MLMGMTEMTPSSNRRDFLTGRAARQQVESAGAHIADALVDAGEHRPVPVSHDTVRLETSAMACHWAVVMNPGPPRQVMTASDALDMVHSLEDQLTVYRDESEVMRINREAGNGPVTVEPNLFNLLRQCREWAKQTCGAFDPTAGPLIRLWRDRRADGRIPTAEEIAETLTRVGIDRVEFDPHGQTIRFPTAGFAFDLGGVGKGYALDRAADHLRREDVADFLIHGGHSSLYARGDHAGQGGWPIGLRNPLFTEERYATLLLQDQGMSTSGSNIQFFRHQGRRYGHLLDPRTGWPAHSPDAEREAPDPEGSLLSVTVLAETAAQADAFSTAFYVMGLEKARDYCHNRPEVSAILIPSPTHGRTLSPIVCNLSEDRLFFEASDRSVVRGPSSVADDVVTSPQTSDNSPRQLTPDN